MKIIETISRAGSLEKPNEDVFGHVGDTVWVMDGATGLANKTYVAGEGESDVSWFVRHMNDGFMRVMHERDCDFPEVVKSASASVLKKFQTLSDEMPNTQEQPSATLAILKQRGDRVRASIMGDSPIIVRTESGEVSGIFNDPALEDLSRRGEAMIAQFLSENPAGGLQAAREKIRPFFHEGRKMQNAEGGYWILALDPEPSDYMEIHEFDIGPDSCALLMSDGFYALVDAYGRYTNESLLEAAAHKGLEALYQELREIEDADPEGHKYPRFKKSDDATAVLVEF